MAERNYYGGESVRGSLGLAGSTEPPLRLRYNSGAVVHEKTFAGAVAVARRLAVIIDENDKTIRPTKIVICRRNSTLNGTLKQVQTGVPIEVIDPGEKYQSFVLRKSTPETPMVLKSQCRSVGTCADADRRCSGCCNNK
jgi:hypothetical protein